MGILFLHIISKTNRKGDVFEKEKITMVSKRAEEIKPSVTLAINQMAKMLISEGKDVINLSVGEPDFPTPEAVKKAGIKAIEENFTKYVANDGIPDLKKAIIEKLEKENKL